ncbi:hypothetical protein VPH35_134124 [Triticum aestivum]
MTRLIIEIKANAINAAAGEILAILESTSKHEPNIYFHGWGGLGASTALRVVAQCLKSSTAEEMNFDKVVHVDCSLWQSMRALQKAIAEELELPQSLMAIFDQHDEEDDFNGIDQGSRGVILDVTAEIFRKLFNSTFVGIFHNGSNNYINLYDCGVPITEFLSNKVLWTWGTGFRLLYEKLEGELVNAKPDIFMEVVQWQDHAMHEEAADCFHYAWARRFVGRIDWEMHASNYWVCDGIVQGQDNKSAWEVGNALQRNIHLDWIMEHVGIEEKIDACISIPNDRWVSATHQAQLHDGNGVLPPRATSFFLLAEKSNCRRVILPAFMFPDNNRLRVLHLTWCTFSFTSPPFLCCSHLRFLLLDHCTDDVREEHHQSNNHNGSCFQKLWVLDLRNTDWYSNKMMYLMDELGELNVERVKDWRIVDLCGGRTSLDRLRVTADTDSTTEIVRQQLVPNLSSSRHLKTIILDNCVGLEKVIPNVLPPSLESFSFIINGAAISKISSISFRGLVKLKSVLLRGLMESLQELDLSSTAVKTLDLREVVALNLKRLILLGCEKLQAIQWPPRDRRTKMLEQVASFNRYISIRDARILRSLVAVEEHFNYRCGHLEMTSSPASSVTVGGGECAQVISQPNNYLYTRDIIFQDLLQAVAANEGAIGWMWPAAPDLAPEKFTDWYIHIKDEDEMKSGLLQQQGSTQGTSTGASLIPNFIHDNAKTLHVHDSLSITSILNPRDSTWNWLERCRVERCPKLSSVFASPTQSDDDGDFVYFYGLTTFWASQLLMARYIWNWSTIWLLDGSSFQYLEFLHLDNCPRLIHVLPLSACMATLRRLVTLEIVCCGDLMEIFPLDPDEYQEEQTVIEFPKLRYIHLHDLSRLHRICGILDLEVERALEMLRNLAVVKPMNDSDIDVLGVMVLDSLCADLAPSLPETEEEDDTFEAEVVRSTEPGCEDMVEDQNKPKRK